MIRTLIARIQQKRRTIGYPAQEPVLPDWFRGFPKVNASKCVDCGACRKACPTGAVTVGKGRVRLDLGRCLFCGECALACSNGVIAFTGDYRLAARRREELDLFGEPLNLATALDEKAKRLFDRSLRLRQVSAGGCNACEADTNVLGTVVFDLGRFGIQFVASPRHADGLLITGPVTENMREALKKTYDAVSAPKLVIAIGACAISGGPYIDHPEVHNGAASVVPVDLFVPGCPPHPITILDGLLRLLGKIR
jgi:Ni,Fe-hydrogenase III small subunit/Pyruvate/2-oxoacid:ferredoxin oxidoreductase delta subunit